MNKSSSSTFVPCWPRHLLLSLLSLTVVVDRGGAGAVSGFLLLLLRARAQRPAAAASRSSSASPRTLLFDARRDGSDPSNSKEALGHEPQQDVPTARVFEVVGGGGRLGSLFFRQPGAAAVPRGVAAGCFSHPGDPIVVAVPARAWKSVLGETLPSSGEGRLDDLVWVGNGVPLSEFENSTVVVPHFGVLDVGADPTTSPDSPPTYVYGKHAAFMEGVLHREGVLRTEVVEDWDAVVVRAARKLLWASCMWLLCHYNEGDSTDATEQVQLPLTVSQVHERRQDLLEQLVDELLPVLGRVVASVTSASKSDVALVVDRDATLAYMEAYSRSMPDAVPSKRLAVEEVRERNGVWLHFDDTTDDHHPQTLHRKLLLNVGGEGALKHAQQQHDDDNDSRQRQRQRISIPELDKVIWGTTTSRHTTGKSSQTTTRTTQHNYQSPRTAIVIGGGIIGSSIALNLARRGVGVTVVNEQQKQQQRSNDAVNTTYENDPTPAVGVTTPASWAWINANRKLPLSYRWLNVLGMRGWRTDEAFAASKPRFCGSLVQYRSTTPALLSCGYRVEGPLSEERVQELEPYANFQFDQGPIYYFPEEGSVDPTAAVQCLHEACRRVGVTFRHGQTVTNLVRDDTTADGSKVVGVITTSTTARSSESNDSEKEKATLPADVVIVAAGIGSAAKHLGDLPMTPNLGQIAYAATKSTATTPISTPPSLSRILVDTIRQSHVLQRPGGTIVVGGGFLEVGGSPSAAAEEAPEGSVSTCTSTTVISDALGERGAELLRVAGQLAPGLVSNSRYTHSAQAVRPMPKDGLPAVGFLEDGLYAAVTHSGVTLAPILGAAVATEICWGVDLDLLQCYRPSRLFVAHNEDEDNS